MMYFVLIIVQLLQRSYPGQLPAVRRDIHNVIVPVDFTSKEGVFHFSDLFPFYRESVSGILCAWS